MFRPCLPVFLDGKLVGCFMQDRRFYVYVHRRKTDGSIFYVGKGKGLRYKRTQSRSEYWQRTVAKYGWTYHVAFPNLTEACAFSIEKMLIASLPRLTNICEGGGGATGYKHSDELKEWRRQNMLGENNPMYGRHEPLSEDHKAKIGKSNSKPKPDGFGKMISDRFTGVKYSDERKSRLREIHKGRHVGKENPMYGTTRENSPNFDPTEFIFIHPDHGEVISTTYDMERKYNIGKGKIRLVARGMRKTAEGWKLKPADDEELPDAVIAETEKLRRYAA